MRDDKPLFLKFRNEKGEVQVCLALPDNPSEGMQAGFSCCNPKDMHLPRKERTPRHRFTSEGRMKKKPITIVLSQELKDVPENEQYTFVREAVINFMGTYLEHNLGLRRYTGSPERCEFHQWFSDFYRDLVADG